MVAVAVLYHRDVVRTLACTTRRRRATMAPHRGVYIYHLTACGATARRQLGSRDARHDDVTRRLTAAAKCIVDYLFAFNDLTHITPAC